MNQLKLTLKKSPIARLPAHKKSVQGLGLKRLHQSVIVQATPENLGMIHQVRYLLSVEEC